MIPKSPIPHGMSGEMVVSLLRIFRGGRGDDCYTEPMYRLENFGMVDHQGHLTERGKDVANKIELYIGAEVRV